MPSLDRRGAGGRRAARAVDLDEAEAAGAEGFKAVGRAEFGMLAQILGKVVGVAGGSHHRSITARLRFDERGGNAGERPHIRCRSVRDALHAVMLAPDDDHVRRLFCKRFGDLIDQRATAQPGQCLVAAETRRLAAGDHRAENGAPVDTQKADAAVHYSAASGTRAPKSSGQCLSALITG
jgi:hypothetical protein